MISVSKLLYDTENFGDRLRYNRKAHSQRDGAIEGAGPVVVWNVTRACNLRCVHCYAAASAEKDSDELTTKQGKKLIDDLAEFKVPVLLFSGGEPLARPDLLELASYAVGKGIRCVISTNGTLIDRRMAENIKSAGIGYVGISLDGIGERNDKFRGREGAFDKALNGIRNCRLVGQRVGLRFTISKYNYDQVDDIFDLVEREEIPRVCFYHLVYSGRGKEIMKDDISHRDTRAVLDLIMKRTEGFFSGGKNKEILTVDNHADGVYIYLKLREQDPVRAERALHLLKQNGGNRSGIAIGQVDWRGEVHPDQFTQNYPLGNVKETPFREIWTGVSNPIMAGLKNRKPLLKGRCLGCKWLDVCNGNFRPRAEAVYNDFWASDPACYLTDDEISIEE
ncbi:MAG TPA: putative heme d1 biosynthesis radical SAM protein NirJ1 [Clostridia bacterium]|nr:putative heme d1 biosynthesis radical SAM protein NirJ1 [Clostridia bacterium]